MSEQEDWNKVTDSLEEEFGKDHNSAEVRRKIDKEKRDGRLVEMSLDCELVVDYREMKDETIMKVSGHDGRNYVFKTFTSNKDEEELLEFLEEKLELDIEKRE